MRKRRGVLVLGGVLGIMVLLATGGLERLLADPAQAPDAEGPNHQKVAPSEKVSAEKSSPSEGKPTGSPVSPEELARLVKQLDADSFADRQAASERLAELGRSAIEALIQAATSESLEANVRALDILRKDLDARDEELRGLAKSALEKIAAGPRAPSARRAQDILKAYEEREKLQQQTAQMPGGIRVAVQAQMVPGQGVRRIQVVDGVKTIEGEDKDGKFRIVEDPKEGITVELTRKKDGKEVTEKFQAKTPQELLKKNAEAYEVYKRQSQQGGVMIQAGPVAVAQVQLVPGQVQRRSTVELASRQLPGWISILERMLTDEAVKQGSKESLEELKKKSQEARQSLEKLEKRLQEAIEQKATEEAEKTKEGEKSQEDQKEAPAKPTPPAPAEKP